jgi:integrase
LLGDYSLERVSKDLIIRHLDRFRSEGNAPATLNRKLSALSVFLGWAKERGLISSNPAREIKRAKENNMRHRYLTDDERINLWNAAKEVDPRMYGLIVTATVSGMRASEMLGLRWADVDFDHEHITLHTTKNDEPRIVPLTGPALKVLRARKNGQRPSERVFGVGTFPRHLWRQALKAAGIDDLRFHDLRHSAASFLVQHGVDIRVVADILGHRTITTTMRYAHVATKTTRAALNSTWADVSD